jgi:hypothetical protein
MSRVALGGEAAHQGRGAAEGGKLRQRLSPACRFGLDPWLIHEEILEDELPFATFEWTTATAANNLASWERPSLSANEFVLCFAVWAGERCCCQRIGSHGERGQTPAMPRKKPKLILAADRVAKARKIVADRRELIMTLKASGRSTLAAEHTLQIFVSSLKHLEDHERRIREEDKAKPRETKKVWRIRNRTPVRQVSVARIRANAAAMGFLRSPGR